MPPDATRKRLPRLEIRRHPIDDGPPAAVIIGADQQVHILPPEDAEIPDPERLLLVEVEHRFVEAGDGAEAAVLLVFDARVGALIAAAIALWLRAPFLIVVIVGAAAAALLRFI